jgi:dihydropteroate synthase
MHEFVNFTCRKDLLLMVSKDTFFSERQSLNCRGQLLHFNPPLIMGILNVTPDSFYAGSRVQETDAILEKAGEMISSGARILDVGAYSSRPGAGEISEKEELDRLAKVLPRLRESFPGTILSVDTFRSGVARKGVENFGADMINDISGGDLDREMFPVISRLGVPYIIMHMRGTPATMQQHTEYADVVGEIIHELSGKINRLNRLGVKDIILDPGFGFAKTIQQNFEILNNLDRFGIFRQPLMVGISRKSMIYLTLDSTADEALNGSTVLHTLALMKGASILRVHDVREARETIELVKKTLEAG